MRTYDLSAGFVGVDRSEDVFHRSKSVAAGCTEVFQRNVVGKVFVECVDTDREGCTEVGNAGVGNFRSLTLLPVGQLFYAVFNAERTVGTCKFEGPPAAETEHCVASLGEHVTYAAVLELHVYGLDGEHQVFGLTACAGLVHE